MIFLRLTSHSTIAVKFTNGTMEPLAELSPGDSYLKMMEELRQQQYIGNWTWNDSGWQKDVEGTFDENLISIFTSEITQLMESVPQNHNISGQNLGVSRPNFFGPRAIAHLEEALDGLGLLPDGFLFRESETMIVSAYESGICCFGTATPREHCGGMGIQGDRSSFLTIGIRYFQDIAM